MALYEKKQVAQAQEKLQEALFRISGVYEEGPTPEIFEMCTLLCRLGYGKEDAEQFVKDFWPTLEFKSEEEKASVRKKVDEVLRADEKDLLKY